MKTFTQSLIHRVTFQRQVAERDSEGVLQVSWQDVWLDSETALIDVPPGARIVREEIFGPVAPIVSWANSARSAAIG